MRPRPRANDINDATSSPGLGIDDRARSRFRRRRRAHFFRPAVAPGYASPGSCSRFQERVGLRPGDCFFPPTIAPAVALGADREPSVNANSVSVEATLLASLTPAFRIWSPRRPPCSPIGAQRNDCRSFSRGRVEVPVLLRPMDSLHGNRRGGRRDAATSSPRLLLHSPTRDWGLPEADPEGASRDLREE